MSGAPDTRVAVLVVGMHRSGTSALTGALGLCGATLPRRLMTAGEDNPAGFWEPRAVVALHEAMLVALGSAWDDGRIADAAQLDGWRPALAAALAEEFDDAALLVLKDPRLSLLLEPWREVLRNAGICPRVVVALRHPMEVAASLERRDGMLLAHGLLLWLRYFLAAERGSRGMRRVFVRYDTLLADPVGCVDAIGAGLGITWPTAPALAAGKLAGFIAPALRHHAAVDMALPEDVVGVAAMAGWEWGQEAATGGAPDPARLDAIAAQLAAADAWLAGTLADRQRRLGAAAREREDLAARLAAAKPLGVGRRIWRGIWRMWLRYQNK